VENVEINVSAGPVKIEAVVKRGCFISFTDRGISDTGIIVKADVKAGVDAPKERGEVLKIFKLYLKRYSLNSRNVIIPYWV
jgi:hypothetical protein